jgi:hypothetical protein
MRWFPWKQPAYNESRLYYKGRSTNVIFIDSMKHSSKKFEINIKSYTYIFICP